MIGPADPLGWAKKPRSRDAIANVHELSSKDRRFRTAVGAGLRYHLPFGPIRIDYGHNLSAKEGEGRGMLHITVGFAF